MEKVKLFFRMVLFLILNGIIVIQKIKLKEETYLNQITKQNISNINQNI
jgi:hypothetical protein